MRNVSGLMNRQQRRRERQATKLASLLIALEIVAAERRPRQLQRALRASLSASR
jgi:hypothetical protein